MNPFILILVALAAWFPAMVAGQTIPDSLLSAATTSTDSTGRPWAYVAFSPQNNGVLRGRSLAVYLKPGLPQDPGSFTQQGIVSPVLETSLVSVFINRGGQLGENLAELDSVLYDLYRTRTAERPVLVSPMPAPPKPPLAEMLAGLLNRAAGDADTASSLRLLGMTHPSVRMALGEAWAAPLTAAPGSPITLEVREWSTAGDGGVLARLTITAGQPVVMPAPGPPVQVPDLTPSGDLNIKLRWGQDEDLRRQSPLSAGFNVWRMAKSFAIAQGVESSAPSLAQLRSWVASGQAVAASDRPVVVRKLMTPAQAADLVADSTTSFMSDDGQRFRTNGAGQNIDEPFNEGDEYTFFVTTRDILGRDGPPSLPGHGIVCRTLPPPVPAELRLENHWSPDDGATTGMQTLQFIWKANTNTTRDVTHHYEIFRGDDLRLLQSPEGKAMLETAGPIAANQTHGADGAIMSFIDTTSEALTAGFGETLWYSVRAVHLSPLGPIKSDFAAPVMMAKRQREGPPAPDGFVETNCSRASVIFSNEQTTTVPEQLVDDGLVRVRLVCQRLDPGIAHVDLSVRVGTEVTDLGRHLYPSDGDFVAADMEIPANALPSQSMAAICQSTTHTGMLSNPKEITLTHLASGTRRVANFQTKSLANSDLVPGEAFSDPLLEEDQSATGMATESGLGLALVNPALNGRQVVIQTSPAAGLLGVWTTRGHAMVRDSKVYFPAPPTPSGQAPVALDCRIFPIREFGGTCTDVAYHPGTGQSGKLGVVIFTTERTAEYRLFRRINDGPYTLVGQGGALYEASNPVNAVRREDDALPMEDATICYFAQTVDRDGNASAMVRLGACTERKSPVLPKPRLSPPQAIGTLAEAKMKLTWMCPPQGVERFMITIKAKGGATAQSVLENAAAFDLAQPVSPALAGRTVTYLGSDSEGKVIPTQQAAGPASQSGGGDTMSALILGNARLTFQKMVQSSSFLTPPLGNNYPNEPPFTAEFTVQPGVTYSVFVQAVRGTILNGQGRGPASAKYEFKWEVPVSGPEPEVAWPARPLPDVIQISGVGVAEVDPVLWPSGMNGERPVGVKLASLPSQGSEDFSTTLIPNEVVYAPRPTSPGYRKPDPNEHLPRPLGNGIRQVQGVVLFRRQVGNQLFPSVPGDTIQVSPLIGKIAWIPTMVGDFAASRLIDPFFAIKHHHPIDALNSLDLYLLDTLGVVDGARYQYYLVCFGADGEITQTIDAGYYGPN